MTHMYDTDLLYNQHMSEAEQQRFAAMYARVFEGQGIKTIHDVTIGAGGTTLPLSRLGYTVSGSDLSENLLERAKINFRGAGYEVELFPADLRTFGESLKSPVDCVISSGNTLPHVDLDGFRAFLSTSRGALNDGGHLFFDIRNWDAIANEHPLMHSRDPFVMTAEEYKNAFLLFSWHDDGSVTFNFALYTDKNGKHESIVYSPPAPRYYPLLRGDVEEALAANGFELMRYFDLDDEWIHNSIMIKEKVGDFDKDFENIQWYGVLARKI